MIVSRFEISSIQAAVITHTGGPANAVTFGSRLNLSRTLMLTARLSFPAAIKAKAGADSTVAKENITSSGKNTVKKALKFEI